ncbi:PEP-CTERM motif protein [Botrimarina colliarenosi]|uniref:PEP-CTERM motif protein n=1 Tax=Botrimarina colliarenosi TaxID=2528001 RepID=A0A5C6AJ60_9BACT|nr:PEP-CTERM sorting domain-containing protein [Botrimarina colliarenosi]TWT99440.1 PEP-CTERM motif protein [Botrimarina colliarenosi]
MSQATTSKTARRAAYSLAAGAAAGMTTSGADAAITHVVLDEDVVGVEFIDLNNDGLLDVNFTNKSYDPMLGLQNYQGLSAPYFGWNVAGFNNGTSYVSALAAGTVIDGSLVNGTSPFIGSLSFGSINPIAEFTNVTGAFIGYRFPSGGGSAYGWARVDIDNAAGTFVIRDYAFESEPGVAIQAGEIPEPGTLGLLAAGAAGVAAMRRRRAA